jgi:hypothetical protein
MKTKFIYYLTLLICSYSFGQLDTYSEKIPLTGVSDSWHTITLPDTVFSKVNDEFSDIRIYGITEKDTIEAPFVLQTSGATGTENEIKFELVNQSFNAKGFYFTYQIPVDESINKIALDFKNTNFDWKVQLEGSQNQNEWFTILEDYRILSIQNTETNYRFTDLIFPDSKFKYFRLFIKTAIKPQLLKSYLVSNKITPASYRSYSASDFSVSEKGKQTYIDIDLKKRVPIGFLKLKVTDDIAYYRTITIDYIADSTETEKGWRYSYRNLYRGTLTSFKANEFTFRPVLTSKFSVRIANNDNAPLHITDVEAKGYEYTLTTRLMDDAKYYLVYGKENAYKPRYDIQQTGFTFPEDMKPLQLGQPEIIEKKPPFVKAPLFENKLWLWLLMGTIILILGGFTLKMMQQK